jgi:uncharacterized DUF497 family protein
MKFDWDDDKNAENKRKHGLSFELAAEVFDDPFYVVIEDQMVEGEQRFWAFGRLQNLVVIVVVHTYFELTVEGDIEEGVRIISARKATPLERGFYEEEVE